MPAPVRTSAEEAKTDTIPRSYAPAYQGPSYSNQHLKPKVDGESSSESGKIYLQSRF